MKGDSDLEGSLIKYNLFNYVRMYRVYVTDNNYVILYIGSRGNRIYYLKLGKCTIRNVNGKRLAFQEEGIAGFDKAHIEEFVEYIYLTGAEKYFLGSVEKHNLKIAGRLDCVVDKRSLTGNIVDRLCEDYPKDHKNLHHRNYKYNDEVFLIKGCEYIIKDTNTKLIYLGLQYCIGYLSSKERHLFMVLDKKVNSFNINSKIGKYADEGCEHFKFDLKLGSLKPTYKYIKGIDLDNHIAFRINGYSNSLNNL